MGSWFILLLSVIKLATECPSSNIEKLITCQRSSGNEITFLTDVARDSQAKTMFVLEDYSFESFFYLDDDYLYMVMMIVMMMRTIFTLRRSTMKTLRCSSALSIDSACNDIFPKIVVLLVFNGMMMICIYKQNCERDWDIGVPELLASGINFAHLCPNEEYDS